MSSNHHTPFTTANTHSISDLNGPLSELDAAITANVGKLNSYTVATVPTASSYTGFMIYVTDDVGGAIPAFSDGTDWRRSTDRAIVSTT